MYCAVFEVRCARIGYIKAKDPWHFVQVNKDTVSVNARILPLRTSQPSDFFEIRRLGLLYTTSAAKQKNIFFRPFFKKQKFSPPPLYTSESQVPPFSTSKSTETGGSIKGGGGVTA